MDGNKGAQCRVAKHETSLGSEKVMNMIFRARLFILFCPFLAAFVPQEFQLSPSQTSAAGKIPRGWHK
jgi:hypothetical protein